jgi:hypothetical protein
MPTVLAAALITGEANCELRVDCPSFTDLGDVLTHVCECRGVELESTALVLHAVAGLPPRPTTVAERVTTKRPLTM